ncbi:hypothetical protein niasHT_024213 [Heterodera trifolii]|uniref:Uncharacterized protein n=1 Tax=Heterodera trifolii TaxID=157864 RepID=A0ABD2JLY9_9BILA
MNSFYGGPTFQSTPVAAVTAGGPGPPPMPMEAWKGPLVGVAGHHLGPTMSGAEAHGTTDSSKLMTKWGGHPVDYSKVSQNEMPSMGAAPFTPSGAPYGGGAAAWNEPHHQQNNHHAQQQFAQFNLSQAEAAAAMAQADNKFLQMSLKAPAGTFQLQGIPQQAPSGPFTPPMDLINGQWGRGEINQCTPWNLEMNGIDPSHSGPPPSHPNYRKWEQQHRGPPPDDGTQLFGHGGFGSIGAAGGYGGVHVYGGGERMIPGGIPQFVGAGARGPSMANRGWDSSGGNANKFVPELSAAGPSGGGNGSHRKFTQFSGPPPPLNIIPPRHPPMFGHLHPPPLFTSLNPPHAASAQFNPMGTFNLQNGTTASNIQQTGGLSEDAIWQDPNGELRKWQRDTGTSIWGDPAEQTGPIQRWQQFTADEVVAKSNLLAKEGAEVVESGWGELPPIGNGTNSGTNSNSSNNETTQTVGGTSTNQQLTKGGGGGTAGRSGGAWNGGAAEGDAPQQQMGNSGGWSDQKPASANMSQPHGAHYQIAQQQMPPNNFVLPPATTVSNATVGQPPSLLAMIDSNAAEATEGGGAQRKAMSPAHQQQSGNSAMMQSTAPQTMGQTLKVSLAEELSTLGTHGMGSGFW